MNVVNLIAIIVIPILAVIIGQKLQEKAQKRNDKIQIFKILMTSRIYGWTPESVQALNLLEIVFAVVPFDQSFLLEYKDFVWWTM